MRLAPTDGKERRICLEEALCLSFDGRRTIYGSMVVSKFASFWVRVRGFARGREFLKKLEDFSDFYKSF